MRFKLSQFLLIWSLRTAGVAYRRKLAGASGGVLVTVPLWISWRLLMLGEWVGGEQKP